MSAKYLRNWIKQTEIDQGQREGYIMEKSERTVIRYEKRAINRQTGVITALMIWLGLQTVRQT